MSIEELATIYDRFSRDTQALYLANLIHHITIAIRGCYADKAQVVNSHQLSKVGKVMSIHQLTLHLHLPHREDEDAEQHILILALIYSSFLLKLPQLVSW